MATSSVRKHNFDPTVFRDPEMSSKDGKITPTDYQAAQTLRNFIKNNNPTGNGFINGEQITEGAEKGQVTSNGRVTVLTTTQQAAFNKLKDDNGALFNRLDGGSDGSNDNYIGVVDINDAIQKTKRLHGSQTSNEGYWSDPNGSMNPSQAKTTLANFFNDRFGDDWNSVSQETLRQIANNDKYRGPDDKWTSVGSHQVARAAGLLLGHWSELHIGEGNSLGTLTPQELAKWNSL